MAWRPRGIYCLNLVTLAILRSEQVAWRAVHRHNHHRAHYVSTDHQKRPAPLYAVGPWQCLWNDHLNIANMDRGCWVCRQTSKGRPNLFMASRTSCRQYPHWFLLSIFTNSPSWRYCTAVTPQYVSWVQNKSKTKTDKGHEEQQALSIVAPKCQAVTLWGGETSS